MRTILSLALGMVLTASALAQDPVDVCKQIYAPWGCSKVEVLKSCLGKLTYYEVQAEDDDGISHVSYLDGSTIRMFSFLRDKFVMFKLISRNKTTAGLTEYVTKQTQALLPLVTGIASDDKFIVKCGQSELHVGFTTATKDATLMVINVSVMREMAQKD